MHQKFDDDDGEEGAELRRLQVRWQTLRLQHQSGALTDWPKCPRCRGVLQPLALHWLCVNEQCGYRRRDGSKAS